MALGCSHGQPSDMDSTYLTDGWSYFRFNGLFGPYSLPDATDASRLAAIRDGGKGPSIVCLAHRSYPFASNFYTKIQGGDVDGIVEASKVHLKWLEDNGLKDAVIIDIGNGPERWYDTTYRGYRPNNRSAQEAGRRLANDLISLVLDMGFQLLQEDTLHAYIHQDGTSLPVPLFSGTSIANETRKLWVTECGVHTSIGDSATRANWFAHLLDSVLWEADRKYIHAPYQYGDPAGYGGVWGDASIKAVLQARM